MGEEGGKAPPAQSPAAPKSNAVVLCAGIALRDRLGIVARPFSSARGSPGARD